jgi:multiple antibiotic resistance protein
MDYLLHALVTLFVTVDPVGIAPVFLVLTAGFGPVARRRAAVRASVTAAAVLVSFALVGEPLLGFLGITLAAFRIAGGLLLFVIAFEMVFERRIERKVVTAEKATGGIDDLSSIAIFPLAVPLTSGPGAISATILLASQAANLFGVVTLIAAIIAMLATCLAVFLLAARIEHFLGVTARLLISRLLGVILAALAVQFVADGVLAFPVR